eukprot:gnl/MRDRNA2_/MRDRNA2_109772_c0_seq1.p1 gnl/MRDRNA2_/MRDRNA2_109772_c0~~gnl/MRDRNA2_/MRDRNA2_109772_c0_seq1.p1  ORF type:complete len:660 (-),score=139.31 gnl/MRDRNA2_/MRDRNA2_109772_c0_seq1:7-1986(-)
MIEVETNPEAAEAEKKKALPFDGEFDTVISCVPVEASAYLEIKGFSWLDRKRGQCFRTGIMVEVAEVSFSLVVYPGGVGAAGDRGYVSVFVACKSEKNFRARFKVSLKNWQNTGDHDWDMGQDEQAVYDASKSMFINQKKKTEQPTWGKADFIPLAKLLSANSPFLQNDVLMLELSVCLYAKNPNKYRRKRTELVRPPPPVEPEPKPEEQVKSEPASPKRLARPVVQPAGAGLGADMWSLLLKDKCTDVALRVSDGGQERNLHAHRLVLAARSPVFEEMFFGPEPSVALTGVVPLEMGLQVGLVFLQYLYIGQLDDHVWQNLEMLCHLAGGLHRFKVYALQEQCERHLIACLTEENSPDLLMMADLLSVPNLRKASLDFMASSRQRLGRIQKSAAFARLSDKCPRVLKEVWHRRTSFWQQVATTGPQLQALPMKAWDDQLADTSSMQFGSLTTVHGGTEIEWGIGSPEKNVDQNAEGQQQVALGEIQVTDVSASQSVDAAGQQDSAVSKMGTINEDDEDDRRDKKDKKDKKDKRSRIKSGPDGQEEGLETKDLKSPREKEKKDKKDKRPEGSGSSRLAPEDSMRSDRGSASARSERGSATARPNRGSAGARSPRGSAAVKSPRGSARAKDTPAGSEKPVNSPRSRTATPLKHGETTAID